MNSVNATFSIVLVALAVVMSLHSALATAPDGAWSVDWLGFQATLSSPRAIVVASRQRDPSVSAAPAARQDVTDHLDNLSRLQGIPPLRGSLETGDAQALARLARTIEETPPDTPTALDTEIVGLRKATTHGKLPDRVQPHRFVPSLAVLGDHGLADLFIAGRSNINVAIMEWDRIVNSAGLARQLDLCAADRDRCSTKRLREWHDLLSATQGMTRIERLIHINDFVNSQPYLSDHELFGEDDYWTSLPEFLELSGDCEDFAIAKFFTLKRLGITNDDMRIIVVLDTARSVLHAVLAVTLNDETIYLDSLSNEIHSDRSYAHYIPIYALNETDYWIY